MNRVRPFRIAAFFAIPLLAAQCVSAKDLTPEQSDLFEKHVRPTLVTHCIKCHGEAKQESDLRLDSREAMLTGGAAGPAIVPGKPGESLLLEAVRYESYEMPPSGQLDAALADGLEKWIAAGAPWPEGTVLKPTPKITAEDREWWCYQPIVDPQVPQVDDGSWCRNEIDRFIFARLAAEDMRPAEEAEPLTLVRRVHFALTGLPPDEATIAVTSRGNAAAEYEALVDRLLEDPAYGENQARFWLDLVRYAETDGYRADGARPEAWRYRDYAIRSFNADKPYDRFLTEQLAGDEVDPGNEDAIIATMYLRHWIYEHNQRDVEGQWQQILNDVTETTADVFLAQGVKCARCHDHKFDPILQKDYFRLQAFFTPLLPREDQPVADLATQTRHYEQQQAWETATAEIRRRLHEIETPALHAHTTGEGIDKFVKEIRALCAMRPVDRAPYEHQIASLAGRQFQVHPEKLTEWLAEDLEAERQRLLKRLAEFDSLKPEPLPTMKFVASDVGPVAPPTYITGAAEKVPVEPGILTILDPEPATIVAPPEALESTGRRTALAAWLTDPANPLTARVMVNRVWQQHFGRGLVESSSDFGRLGKPPSHPELLDWLASRFIADGWSLKKLHRRILTSATYRQVSRRESDARIDSIDPGNTLLWRMNPRRLSGEEIVDSILAASGELKSVKRSIYQPVRRNSLDPLLSAFDFPDRITSCCERHRTTTATQALVLANNPWSHERAATIGGRLPNDGASDSEFVREAYVKLFGREASADEVEPAVRFIEEYARRTPAVPTPPSPTELVTMPGTGDRAIDLQPGGSLQLGLEGFDRLPDGDFTVEAIVLLRSLYEDASVRTIASHWSGDEQQPGWSFGVTSTKSSFKPRNLILQLVGKTGDGDALHYEVIASGLRPELNKPYYLAVSVNLDDTSEQGVTFLMQDLSVKNDSLKTAHVKHTVTREIRPDRDLCIGGRDGRHLWDGLIDGFRLASVATAISPVAKIDRAPDPKVDLADLRFEKPDELGFDSSPAGNHAWTKIEVPHVITPHERARIAFVHALLNSNELIYVD
ncbi:MAG: PSD1 and planctomycete cytochrome C domain-containing protein [Planctomycetaceae bacterium]